MHLLSSTADSPNHLTQVRSEGKEYVVKEGDVSGLWLRVRVRLVAVLGVGSRSMRSLVLVLVLGVGSRSITSRKALRPFACRPLSFGA